MSVDAAPRKLAAPPIVEVACSFEFEPLRALDALWLGRVWEVFSADYPVGRVHPPIVTRPELHLGPPELRAWYVSEDEEFIVQLQRDRFVFNWRRPDARDPNARYPRFRDHEDLAGVNSRANTAFQDFAKFWGKHHGERPEVLRCALTKVDVLRRNEHWQTLDTLAILVPRLAPLLGEGNKGEFNHLDISLETQRSHVKLASRWHLRGTTGQQAALRWETTGVRAVGTQDNSIDLTEVFLDLNRAVNDLFFGDLSRDALSVFKAEEETQE